jgi:hypothetical protein
MFNICKVRVLGHAAVGVNNPNPFDSALGRELNVCSLTRRPALLYAHVHATATNTTTVVAHRDRPTLTTHRRVTPKRISKEIALMSLWQSYRNLAPRTRLFIGGGIMAYGVFGLLASDQAEQLLGWTATEEDRKRLKEELPKVHVVDRIDK